MATEVETRHPRTRYHIPSLVPLHPVGPAGAEPVDIRLFN